ncbi:ribosomal protein mL43 [Acrasis kona]|uniref:Large ribosomal subunit protein mL43 n=1 Tax=Acrasis kona TaxID=1008807 RepID=A0AAW2YY85_9EUKA
MSRKGVLQLYKVGLQYCDLSGASKGARDVIEKSVVDLAKMYPNINFFVQVVRNKEPSLAGHFLNGRIKRHQIGNKSAEEIVRKIYELRCQWGHKPEKIGSGKKTFNPSVQGQWTPFLWMKTPREFVERPYKESKKDKKKRMLAMPIDHT